MNYFKSVLLKIFKVFYFLKITRHENAFLMTVRNPSIPKRKNSLQEMSI